MWDEAIRVVHELFQTEGWKDREVVLNDVVHLTTQVNGFRFLNQELEAIRLMHFHI